MARSKSEDEPSLGENVAFKFPEDEDLMLSTRERPQVPTVLMDEINTAQYAMATLERSSLSELNGLLKADKGLIPSGLGERAFVGLLNIYRAQDPTYSRQLFQFPIRHLVEDYVYPGRGFRASGKEVALVLDQLDRIANTRLIANKWHSTGRTERFNAALIDYVRTVYEGDNNSLQMIEVAWGLQMWKSLQAKYTKKLDRHIYMAIKKPIDLRLWRWVDSQLGRKAEQKVKSIQEFARNRLGLQNGKTIARGGRTASSYIAKQLQASTKRLNGFGYPVRLVIDRQPDDFRLTFQRLEKGPNEVVDAPDDAGALLQHFAKAVHGATVTRHRFPAADRALAQIWVTAYGLEASCWMATKAAQLMRAETGVKAKTFRRLEIYTDEARGAWEHWVKEQAGQKRFSFSGNENENEKPKKPLPTWSEYIDKMLARSVDMLRDKKLFVEAEADLKAQIGTAWKTMGNTTRRKMINGAAKTRKIEALSLLEEDTYNALERCELETMIKERHGISLSELE